MENQDKPNLYAVMEKIGNMDAKIDLILTSIGKQDNRIGCVEKVQNEMVGKISVWSAIAGTIFGIIGSVITWLVTRNN